MTNEDHYQELQVASEESEIPSKRKYVGRTCFGLILTFVTCAFLYRISGDSVNSEVSLWSDTSCCLYNDQCIGDAWCNASKDRCLGPCNANNDKKWGPPGGGPSPSPTSHGCGYAVSSGPGECQKAESEVGETMSCFAYGGSADPCSLNCNNDPAQGMNKDPSLCTGTEFFLWDEPDTQGFSYTWAGQKWMEYSNKWSSELTQLRNRGVQIIAPAVKNDNPGGNIDAFMSACSSCLTPGSVAKIDGFASNVFVGSWNHGNVAGGVIWSVNQFKPISSKYQNMPFYVTNWGYLGTSNPDDQVAAMGATQSFFGSDSPVMKVFYFAAKDYGGNTKNNEFSAVSRGQSLGAHWHQTCSALQLN